MLQLCWPESRHYSHDFQGRATDDLVPNIQLKNLSRALVGARQQILHDRWSNHRAIIVCMLEQCLRITDDAASTREAPLTSQNRAVHSL